MNEILSNLLSLFYFLLTGLLIVIILAVFFEIILKKFATKKGKLKIYGIFLGLSKKDIFCLSLLTINYILVIYCLFTTDLNLMYLVGMLLLSFIYNLVYLRPFNGIFSVFSNIVIYCALYSKNIFYNYLMEIQFVWYVVVIYVILIIFCLLYVSYFLLKDIEFILKKNNHVAKKYNRNGEENESIKKNG